MTTGTVPPMDDPSKHVASLSPEELQWLADFRDEVRETVIDGDAQDCSSPDCIADAIYEIVRTRIRSLDAARSSSLDVDEVLGRFREIAPYDERYAEALLDAARTPRETPEPPALSPGQAEGLTAEMIGVESAIKEALDRAGKVTRTLSYFTVVVEDRPLLTPRETPSHPDDGHEHRFTCLRCGVDPAPRETPAGAVEAMPEASMQIASLAAIKDAIYDFDDEAMISPEAQAAIILTRLTASGWRLVRTDGEM